MKGKFLIIVLALIWGCSNSEVKESPKESQTQTSSRSQSNDKYNDLRYTDSDPGLPYELTNVQSARGGVVPNFPQKYLQDPLVFQNIPGSPFGKEPVAVVGSDKAVLYENAFAANPKDLSFLKDLKVITAIPFGTLVPLRTEYKDPQGASESGDDSKRPDGTYYFGGFIKFEEHLNTFFETEYQGKKGIIFGADLVGLEQPQDLVLEKAYLYQKPEAAPAFVRYLGAETLGGPLENRLTSDYLAFVPMQEGTDYELTPSTPDDLVALYQKIARQRPVTTFLTTDLVVHSLHLLFDRMLAQVEEDKFLPTLKQMLQGYLNKLTTMKNEAKAGNPKYVETLNLALAYFQIAKALVDSAPGKNPEADLPYGPQVEEKAAYVDTTGFSPEVKKELALIQKAQGFELSPNFGYQEDYSQFKPRGHYTKNERLKAYFRAMMFLGKIHFYLDFSTADSTAVTLKYGPVAVLINKLHKANPDLAKNWKSLFDPITYLVGESDDITFMDLGPLMGEFESKNLGEYLAGEDWKEALKRLSQNVRPPRIQGDPGHLANPQGAPSAEPGASSSPIKGWRFMGQRFTLDSWWFSRLSGPMIRGSQGTRTMVKGLDIAGLLGSKFAQGLLKSERDGFSPLYGQIFDSILKENQGLDKNTWEKTFYNHYLKLVQNLVTFEKGSGFYFTQRDAWDKKTLQTGLSAWAELRHDTILYVKQSGAERAGGGGWERTFRTRPYPRPTHYVEPNLSFFYSLKTMLDQSMKVLDANQFMPENYKTKFADFRVIVDNLTAIVEKEVLDEKITSAQNEFILTASQHLARIVLPTGGDLIQKKDLQMAMVADVHTDGDKGQVLEVATGQPFKIYVPLNDGQGGKRIGIGFTYSYYEFHQPMSNRMNDDEWKAFIYSNPPPEVLDQRRPGWLKGIAP